MLEELQEADVLWPAITTDHPSKHHFVVSHDSSLGRCDDNEFDSSSNDGQLKVISAPIDILKRKRMTIVGDWWEKEEEVLGDMIIPPHILVARRFEQEMVGSVYGSSNRWRKLSHIRVSVLRMTGFLESLS
ncbi:hypothetical protein IEQ34_022518 [Dendrobium chrysotoxum]|uniref:Uncharacterized protein n=1 Tax=Dendrobium chrysotoxum TaxID=161865 RepID=A0AAV7FZ90_DENCH|nr:hypothetical protein IEQ34_022518 [Dendrobium chrysotoxum]